MRFAVDASSIEVNDRFVRKHSGGHDVAIVVYRSADNSVGYRIKGSRRIYSCAPITFLKNWKRIGDGEQKSQ